MSNTDTKSNTSIIKLRHLEIDDYLALRDSMERAYEGTQITVWQKRELQKLVKRFPEGQICIEVDGVVVAIALSIIVDYKKFGDKHTFEEITANHTFTTHEPKGDILYGIEVFVHPEYRGMRLGRRLYDARKELCENLNLRSIVAGGRIPNYRHYRKELTPRQYIEKVKRREIEDPILGFQLANDFHVRKVLRNYDPEDKQSHSFATLLEWNNIYFEKDEQLLGAVKEVVRIGVVQWQMRPLSTFDALVEQMDYFVDTIGDYGCDFCVFPEFFSGPLLYRFNQLSEAEAMKGLAEYAIPLRDKMIEFAVHYNVNIIGGSMPIICEDDLLRNITYLCRRDGTWEYTYKMHLTRDEHSTWGMHGGDLLKTFETDAGKVGILICYDVEFPELTRLMAEQGLQILFVPFQTDTLNGYNRVRICAQARAVENECYVVIAGNVGSLPRVNNLDIQYAQSAIFTPSDFAFPENAIKAHATPNTEMTLIADVNLTLLKELHNFGSVRNLKDRRNDLYKLNWLKK